MNTLQLTLSYETGGRRKMISNLAAAQVEAGHRCELGVLGTDPGPACEQFSSVHCLGRKSVGDLAAVRRLYELCRRKQIDVIHCHDAASQLLVAMMRLRHPRSTPPALMTFHRSLDIESRTWRDRLRNRIAGAVCGPVVAVSEERRRHYIEQNGVSPRRVVCIHNGIDTQQFRPEPAVRGEVRRELGAGESEVVLGAAGHFGREKGLDVVIQAFHRIVVARPKLLLRLVILGTGTEVQRAELERLAAGCSGGRVDFLGFRPDAARWFQGFDVFLHAPRQEAFGLVVAEAMAIELPAVATRVGGIPEIIDDRITGRLVEPESPAALAEATVELIDSPQTREAMARRARAAVLELFTVEKQAEKYLELYERLVAECGRRRRGRANEAVTEPGATKTAEECVTASN